jgi:hypothetical protein
LHVPYALAGTGAEDAHSALWQCGPGRRGANMLRGAPEPRGSQSVTWVDDLLLNRSKLRSIIGIFSGRLLQRWRRGGPLGCAATTPTAKGDGFPRCGVGGVPSTWRGRRKAPVRSFSAIKSRRYKDTPILITVSAVTPPLVDRLHAPDLQSSCKALRNIS